ncbi:MAG: DUF983 domain-containing protein [Sphingobacteriales bacterium]|nr:MAG: DUF983 domain-containing protein [Sphingobacteriales bacterium]
MSKVSESKPSLIISLFRMKCPVCRKGDVFVNKRIFPLGSCVKMRNNCNNCGERLIYETNNGPGINYALTVMIFFLNILWYWPIFGMSYKDNSVYYFLVTSIVVVILLQPWLMRFSRIVYLYLFFGFRE